jgi:large subunit ribosomal protein L35
MGNKMKTKRGAAKRFSTTGSGKIKFKRAKTRHILTKKTTKQKRHARRDGFIVENEAHLVRIMIPYK